jgi:hypothetical protein
VRDNLRHRRDIERAYLDAIGAAREEIVLANAYFLPGRRFRRALRVAAGRGVRVTILLQGLVEYRLLHYATQALYGNLLAAGIRIFEYQRSFLHAKVAVIDRHWATVGSSNIDPFSLLLAREANVVVLDRRFAEELEQSLAAAMRDGARELPADSWQRQPWYSRLLRSSQLQPAADLRRHQWLRRQALTDDGAAPSRYARDRPVGDGPAPELGQVANGERRLGYDMAEKLKCRRQQRAAGGGVDCPGAGLLRQLLAGRVAHQRQVRVSGDGQPQALLQARSGVASSPAGRRRGRPR